MVLSESLRGIVDFVKNSFTEEGGREEEPFRFPSDGDDYEYPTNGCVALEKAERDDDIETLYGPGTRVKGKNFGKDNGNLTTHPSAYKSGEVTVIEPRAFSESAQIVKKLIDNKTVVLHLDLLDKEQSQRTIDFVCGASHALSGTAQKISDMVFIFTPKSVSLSVENGATQNKFAESLWNKPL